MSLLNSSTFSLNPDLARAADAKDRFVFEYDNYDPRQMKYNGVEREYIELSRFIQSLFISDDGYVIDTGNYRTVNRVILEDIYKKVKKHPILWRIFMVC